MKFSKRKMRFEIWFLLIGMILLALPITFAADISKEYIKSGKYGTIQISDKGVSKADITLEKNTEVCLINCYAEGIVNLKEDNILFSNVKFQNLKTVSYQTINYTIYVDGERYKGEVLKAGAHKWRIEGTKKPYEKIDWIATSLGVELTEWAIWSDGTIVSYWKLDELSGAVKDELGLNNGNNSGAGQGFAGLLNLSYNFTASEYNMVNLTNSSSLKPGTNLSWQLWIRPSSVPAQTRILVMRDSDLEETGILLGSVTGNFIYGAGEDGSSWKWIFYGPNITAGKWQHIVMTYDGSTAKLYVNGTMVNSSAATGNIYYDARPVVFGRNINGTQPYDGLIDEVGMWNRSLTASEVLELYNSGAGSAFESNIAFTLTENSQTYNATTYETISTEGFIVDTTYNNSAYNITANLVYGGVAYAGTRTGTGSSAIFSRNINVPSPATKTFYWEFRLVNTPALTYINSTSHTQTIKSISLALCNATYSIPYINLTFKDETTDTFINGTIPTSTWYYWIVDSTANKTFTFVNISANNPSYAFCFSAQSSTLHHDTTIQYAFTGYPQRRWAYSTALTNSTLNKTLYLLASSDGVYQQVQVQTTVGNSLPGVYITVEKQVGGVWEMIESGTSDSAGIVIFWLNPNYDHRLTATKSGYTSVTYTVRPSSGTYTIIMASGSSDITTETSLKGLLWTISPSPGMLNKDTTYTFTFNLTSSLSNVISCTMEIYNKTLVLSTVSGCTSAGGFLTTDVSTVGQSNMYGRYSVNIGGIYYVLEADANWKTSITNYTSDLTLLDFFRHLRNLNEFGEEEQRAEWSRIVFIFFILMLGLAGVSRATGWDIQSPGGMIVLLLPVIWGLTIAGWFNLSNLSSLYVLDKYYVAVVFTFFAAGYILNSIKREAG